MNTYFTSNGNQGARVAGVRLAVLWCVMVLFMPGMRAQVGAEDSVRVSLVTFYPGAEVFELFGHTEVRVTDSQRDLYYNYGVFDFYAPHFVARFAAGETDYYCVAVTPRMATTGYEGRRMVEQVLNLTSDEARRVRDFLADNALPENSMYRYKFFSDNCSTRPREIIESAFGDSLRFGPLPQGVTYREIVRHYTANYAWERFGIDLALGMPLDTVISARQQMFVPMLLMQALQEGTVTHGGVARKAVLQRNQLLPGAEEGNILPPTPWYATPMAVALLLLVISLLVTWRDIKRGKANRLFDTMLLTVYGLAGCVIFYLTFYSTHEATSPNLNALWLHPFYLLAALLLWWKRARGVVRLHHAIALLAIVVAAVLFVSGLQVPDAAFYPLMLAMALRLATGLISRANA